jgi:hypothetical protein
MRNIRVQLFSPHKTSVLSPEILEIYTTACTIIAYNVTCGQPSFGGAVVVMIVC